MLYTYNEYSKYAFTTPIARQQEKVIVEKIMSMLNNKKYSDIDSFVQNNKDLSFDEFLKQAELDNVVKHWGNTLTDENFKTILQNLSKLSEDKKNFDKQNIKTTTIDDKQFFTYEGKDKNYVLNNSVNTLNPFDEMKNIQETNEDFQTADIKQNTENMINNLEKNKTEKINLQFLNEINSETLSLEEAEILKFAKQQEQQLGSPLRLDIKARIIVDEYNTPMKITRENGVLTLLGDNNEIKGNNIEKNNKQIVFKKDFNVTNSN